MRIGINYDTGVFPGSRQSRAFFSPEQVEFDMNVIARELGCAAVRVTGGDLERLTLAANFAADAGLDVWFSPFPCELDEDGMLAFVLSSLLRISALWASAAARAPGALFRKFGSGIHERAASILGLAHVFCDGHKQRVATNRLELHVAEAGPSTASPDIS
jgi:hypothetical protein